LNKDQGQRTKKNIIYSEKDEEEKVNMKITVKFMVDSQENYFAFFTNETTFCAAFSKSFSAVIGNEL